MSDLTPRPPRDSPDDRDLPFQYVDSGRPPSGPGAGWGGRAHWNGGGGGGGAGGAHPAADDTIELAEVLAILRRRIWLVVACVVAGGALAWGLHEWRADQYQATAVIRVEDPRGQMSERLGGFEPLGTGTDPIRSALEVLTSRGVLGRIVDQEGLRLVAANGAVSRAVLADLEVGEFALPDTLHLAFGSSGVQVASTRSDEVVEANYGQRIEVGEVSFRVNEPPAVSEARFTLQEREEAIAHLERYLVSQPRPETNVVDVRYTATDPEWPSGSRTGRWRSSRSAPCWRPGPSRSGAASFWRSSWPRPTPPCGWPRPSSPPSGARSRW